MKNMALIIVFLSVFSCSEFTMAAYSSRGTELYPISTTDIGIMNGIFGETFVAKYQKRCYVSRENLDDEVSGLYFQITDDIQIDMSSVQNPDANTLCVVHEFTHAYQNKVLHRNMNSNEIISYSIPFYALNKQVSLEQEAQIVSVYAGLQKWEFVLSDGQFIQRDRLPVLVKYMNTFMEFSL